jgi:hypothetical protein
LATIPTTMIAAETAETVAVHARLSPRAPVLRDGVEGAVIRSSLVQLRMHPTVIVSAAERDSSGTSEGDSDEAFALFTFPSLAEYERYRIAAASDPECQDAFRFARDSGCIRRYERRFLTPVFE